MPNNILEECREHLQCMVGICENGRRRSTDRWRLLIRPFISALPAGSMCSGNQEGSLKSAFLKMYTGMNTTKR
ncbi:hypothetical protein DPMN_063213 [Dreissena polymorpha]|uniref:Uncharacterized protein n=1 Tax=Dreissena polymorpha TaxID=45954 RepID=A0A9D4CB06_DREPO|nr:hypothetical protein DPMN_063213 [Dreissena polymorpha]